ncbi:MAG: sulfatase [Cyclobacteriaceae bacterium]
MYKFLILLSSLFLTLGCSVEKQEKKKQPNFVWIMSEDNSKHFMKMFDENGIATPHIEKLAANGVTFTRAFSNAPVCSAARTTLETTCYGPRIGTQFHRKSEIVPMPDGLKMFPEYLRQAGYFTVNKTKTDYNALSGENVWDEKSKDGHWRNRKEGQPFFYKRTYTESHESRLHFDADLVQTYNPTVHPDSVFLNPNHPDTELFRFTSAYYRDRIIMNDDFVGSVVEELEKDGLLEDTFIFYFGDHGGVLPGSKGYLYETGLHVPLVVRIPENYKDLVSHKQGSSSDAFISFVDFGPTLLKLAGLDIPEVSDGKPFMGLEMPESNNVTFGYADRFDEKYDLVRSVRKGKFKYMRNYQPFNPDGLHNDYRYKCLAFEEWRELFKQGKLNDIQKHFFVPRPAEELFDIDADPYETKNLAADPAYREQVKEMRQTLNEWVKGMPDLSFYPESELVKSAFDNPTGFGQAHKDDINKLVDIADLSLMSFADAKDKISDALDADDPMKKYWGLIVCSSFGENASEFYSKAKELTKDEHLLVRTRAAEFLALNGEQNPKDVINQVLKETKQDIEALLVLNTVVLLMDGPYKYTFDIDESFFSEEILKRDWIQRRLEYISERQSKS